MIKKKSNSHVNGTSWQHSPVTKHQCVSSVSIFVILGLLWLDYRFALAYTAGYFLLLVFIAPYSLKLAFFLPIINKAPFAVNQVALTFDDGPDDEVTGPLLDLLAKHHVQATFFVTGSKVNKNPQLIHRMIDEGHEIGNHTQHHDVLLMLRRKHTIRKEIEDCQHQLLQLGIRPFAFRPPVGITNPKLYKILKQLGMYCVGFSCRPRDFGNRNIQNLGRRILDKVKAGHIVLLHDFKPNPDFPIKVWLSEIELLISGLKGSQLEPVVLSRLINRPVVQRIP